MQINLKGKCGWKSNGLILMIKDMPTRNVVPWIWESCSYINFPSRQYLYRGKSTKQKFLKSLGEIFMPVKTDTSFPKV